MDVIILLNLPDFLPSLTAILLLVAIGTVIFFFAHLLFLLWKPLPLLILSIPIIVTEGHFISPGTALLAIVLVVCNIPAFFFWGQLGRDAPESPGGCTAASFAYLAMMPVQICSLLVQNMVITSPLTPQNLVSPLRIIWLPLVIPHLVALSLWGWKKWKPSKANSESQHE